MTPTEPDHVDSEALKTIVGAVYPAMLSEPTTVRARAQTAYTIASAIAAALVTAGVVAKIKEFPAVVQVFGVLAVATWLLAAGLFINISRRVTKIPRTDDDLLTAEVFVALLTVMWVTLRPSRPTVHAAA